MIILNIETIKKIQAEIGRTLEGKNSDYGGSFEETRRKFGMVATIIRLTDKLNRLSTLTQLAPRIANESIEDTLKDLIGYCLLELEYRAEERNNDSTRSD